MEAFRQRLRQLRNERRLACEAVAQLCGLSKNVVARYEHGIGQPTAHSLILLADFFNVSTDYLLGRSDLRNWH